MLLKEWDHNLSQWEQYPPQLPISRHKKLFDNHFYNPQRPALPRPHTPTPPPTAAPARVWHRVDLPDSRNTSNHTNR